MNLVIYPFLKLGFLIAQRVHEGVINHPTEPTMGLGELLAIFEGPAQS